MRILISTSYPDIMNTTFCTWCPDDATELCSLRKQKRKKLKKVFNNGTVASAPSFFSEGTSRWQTIQY